MSYYFLVSNLPESITDSNKPMPNAKLELFQKLDSSTYIRVSDKAKFPSNDPMFSPHYIWPIHLNKD